MTNKIVQLGAAGRRNPIALLHQALEHGEDLEGVILAIKVDDTWDTAWSGNDLTHGGLAVGVMLLFRAVQDALVEDDE